MGNTEFKKVQDFTDGVGLKAKGTIEVEYKVASMYVGLIETEGPLGSRKVTSAAYSAGPPELNHNGGASDEYEWTMYLQQDSDPEKGPFTGGKDAFGFVVAQLEGGRLIGWL